MRYLAVSAILVAGALGQSMRVVTITKVLTPETSGIPVPTVSNLISGRAIPAPTHGSKLALASLIASTNPSNSLSLETDKEVVDALKKLLEAIEDHVESGDEDNPDEAIHDNRTSHGRNSLAYTYAMSAATSSVSPSGPSTFYTTLTVTPETTKTVVETSPPNGSLKPFIWKTNGGRPAVGSVISLPKVNGTMVVTGGKPDHAQPQAINRVIPTDYAPHAAAPMVPHAMVTTTSTVTGSQETTTVSSVTGNFTYTSPTTVTGTTTVTSATTVTGVTVRTSATTLYNDVTTSTSGSNAANCNVSRGLAGVLIGALALL